MPDRLQALLEHFSVKAKVFRTGALCGINDADGEGDAGYLHVIRNGKVEVGHERAGILRITQPSLLLYPRPLPHRFITDREQGADTTCARLSFDGGAANPIAMAMPEFICLPLSELEGAEGVLRLLFEEAFSQYCGRQAMLDRLFEVLLIQVLRHLMENGQTRGGMLAGLAHLRLRAALVAMHEQPARDWSLDALAECAGMSRSVFANAFRETVGCTPGSYLQRWRIGIAQKSLRQGRTLKLIAGDVGYGSEAALSRAFKAQSGLSPGQWRSAHKLAKETNGAA
ncbi:AraC family transcriptional regulator [Chitinimonas arctica]|uniref:AraC family transcriptional regulator n=2 Tax=Chitinimonas arctica TaxID=2594795 RepID=A0A516SMS2_9NEIS|nr:AraC family transcriptional regulator [Chitinimonas arctica]